MALAVCRKKMHAAYPRCWQIFDITLDQRSPTAAAAEVGIDVLMQVRRKLPRKPRRIGRGKAPHTLVSSAMPAGEALQKRPAVPAGKTIAPTAARYNERSSFGQIAQCQGNRSGNRQAPIRQAT